MKKVFALILLLPVFTLLLSVSSFSANEPYISKDNYLRMQIVEYNSVDFERAWVYSVAVSDDETLAIGFDNNIILITDNKFNVKSAIKVELVLHPDESIVVDLNWDKNENLQMNTPGLDTVLLVDVNGNLLDDYQVENFQASSAVGTVNGITYGKKVSNFLMYIAPDDACDEVFKVAADGTETILFKSEKNAPYLVLVGLAFFIGGHIFMGVGIYSAYVKQRGKKSIFNKLYQKKFLSKVYADNRATNIYKFRYGVRPFLISFLSIPFAVVLIAIVKLVFEFELNLMYFVFIFGIISAAIKSVLYIERYKIDGNLIFRKKLSKAKSISIPDNAVFIVTSALETNNQLTDNSLVVHVVEGDVHDVVNRLHELPEPLDYFAMLKKMLRLEVFDDYYIKGKYQDKWIYSFKYDEVTTPAIFEEQKRTVIIPQSLLYKIDLDNVKYDLFVDDEQSYNG